jgi:hypothetical protein
MCGTGGEERHWETCCRYSTGGCSEGTPFLVSLRVRDPAGQNLLSRYDLSTRQLLTLWPSRLFYTLTTVFVRLSIAVFLIRICIKRVFKIIIYVAMTMIVAFSIFYFFLVLFQCSPIDYFWNRKTPLDRYIFLCGEGHDSPLSLHILLGNC